MQKKLKLCNSLSTSAQQFYLIKFYFYSKNAKNENALKIREKKSIENMFVEIL